jgi:hypothetical protein
MRRVRPRCGRVNYSDDPSREPEKETGPRDDLKRKARSPSKFTCDSDVERCMRDGNIHLLRHAATIASHEHLTSMIELIDDVQPPLQRTVFKILIQNGADLDHDFMCYSLVGFLTNKLPPERAIPLLEELFDTYTFVKRYAQLRFVREMYGIALFRYILFRSFHRDLIVAFFRGCSDSVRSSATSLLLNASSGLSSSNVAAIFHGQTSLYLCLEYMRSVRILCDPGCPALRPALRPDHCPALRSRTEDFLVLSSFWTAMLFDESLSHINFREEHGRACFAWMTALLSSAKVWNNQAQKVDSDTNRRMNIKCFNYPDSFTALHTSCDHPKLLLFETCSERELINILRHDDDDPDEKCVVLHYFGGPGGKGIRESFQLALSRARMFVANEDVFQRVLPRILAPAELSPTPNFDIVSTVLKKAKLVIAREKWCAQFHYLFPLKVRERIKTVLLCAKRNKSLEIGDIWTDVIFPMICTDYSCL